jgi:hypothetical protein
MVRLEMDFKMRNLGIWVSIWDKTENKFKEIDALFDTGAHTSAIDKTVLLNLGYDLDESKLITMSKNYLDENDDYYDLDTFGDWRVDGG